MITFHKRYYEALNSIPTLASENNKINLSKSSELNTLDSQNLINQIESKFALGNISKKIDEELKLFMN